MAEVVFKGFKQVNSGYTGAFEDGYIYFVRTSEAKSGKTADGYILFNSKRYGTSEDALAEIKTLIGTLPKEYGTVVEYITAVAEDLADLANTVEEDEKVTSAALTDLNSRVDEINTHTVNGYAVSGNPVLDGADIKLDGYVKGEEGTAIVATDTVNAALGKLEKKLDDATAGGLNGVDAGSGITVSTLTDNRQTISAKIKTVESEDYLKVDANGLYIQGVDAKITDEIEKLDVSGNTSTAVNGVKVTVNEIDGKVQTPVVAIELGRVADGNTGLTTGDAVYDAIEAKIDSLDVTGNTSDAVSGVTVAITEENGKVQKPVIVIAKGEVASGNANLVNGDTVFHAIDDVISGLDKADSAVAGKIVDAVSEENGIITVSRRYLANTDIKLEKLENPSESGLASEYKLVNGEGTVLGDTIKIAKDQFLKSADYFADATAVPEDKHDYPDGFEFPGIRFEWQLAISGTSSVSWVSVKDLVNTYTAHSGVTLINNDIQGVVDNSGEFLSVSDNGFKVTGVTKAIEDHIAALDATVGSTTIEGGKHVAVEVAELDGKLTGITVTEDIHGNNIDLSGYTKAEGLSAVTEDDTVNEAIGKLEKRIENAVAGGLQKVEAGSGITVSAVSGNSQTITVDIDSTADNGVVLQFNNNKLDVEVDAIEDASGITASNDKLATGKAVNGFVAAEIAKLDVSGNTSNNASGVTVIVNEADGKVETPIVAVATGAVASGNTNLVNGGIVFEALKAKVEDLDADVANTAASAGTAASEQIKVEVVEIDGVLTSVTVKAPEFALPSDIEALDAVVSGGTNDVEISVTEVDGKLTAATAEIKISTTPNNALKTTDTGLFAAVYYEDLDA